MDFGKTITKLRHEHDMTQEELADVLGITTQAVSRWETGSTMPDLSLFPAICNLFDVTSDYLLGIDLERKKEKIEKICNRAHDCMSRGYMSEVREILTAGLKEFPKSYEKIRKSNIVQQKSNIVD